MTADVLATLAAPSWRGIPFPITSLENGFTHEHVEHKFIYVDGMHIETTGRNGLSFLGHIPFNNGIHPGDFEPWAGQVLYPTLFRKFLNAVLDGSTGEFIHPDFGPIKCKARDITWRYTSNLRDGAEITVRWYETNDDPDEASSLVAGASANSSAQDAAASLDDQLDAVGPLPELGNDTSSFSDMLSSYNDGTESLSGINSKLDNTSSALDRLDDVGLWPLRQATESMRASILNIGGSPATTGASGGGSSIRTYQVPIGTSLASIGIRLGVGVDRLVTMNPKLAKEPGVPPGTQVRY